MVNFKMGMRKFFSILFLSCFESTISFPATSRTFTISRFSAIQRTVKISEDDAASSIAAFKHSETAERCSPPPRVILHDFILKDSALCLYNATWSLQKQVLQKHIDALKKVPGEGLKERQVCPILDSLIIVEHEPVYTLGSSTKDEDVVKLFDRIHKDNVTASPGRLGCHQKSLVIRVDRGGEATWHGPGQLIAYPILDLRRYRKDVHWFLRALEEVGIRTCTWTLLQRLDDSFCYDAAESFEVAEKRLADIWGVRFGRVLGYTGCWLLSVGDGEGKLSVVRRRESGFQVPAKVMAAGISIRRWITQHGIAINCNCDLAWAIEDIVPCGIKDLPVENLDNIARYLSGTQHNACQITPSSTKPYLLHAFEEVFGMDLSNTPEL